MRGLSRLLVVMISVATLVLMAAVGAAAASGTLGASRAGAAVVKVLDNGRHTGECHLPKKPHKHGTPGHKHHPCGDDGDNSD